MNAKRYAAAVTELLLIFPAFLFMSSLFVRNLQPQQFEPAHTAQRIVTWYAERLHIGLWLLLIALPVAVLVSGWWILSRQWSKDAELRLAIRDTISKLRSHAATAMVAGATIVSLGVLLIVGLHVLTD